MTNPKACFSKHSQWPPKSFRLCRAWELVLFNPSLDVWNTFLFYKLHWCYEFFKTNHSIIIHIVLFHLVKIIFVGFVNKTSFAAILSVIFFPCTVFGVEMARKQVSAAWKFYWTNCWTPNTVTLLLAVATWGTLLEGQRVCRLHLLVESMGIDSVVGVSDMLFTCSLV